MNEPTPEQISRLPKWAQDHISYKASQLRIALEKCKAFEDQQTESPFYVDDFCENPRVKRFISCPNQTVCADWAGVHLEIFLPRKDDGQRMFGPEIRFSATQGDSSVRNPVVIVPRGIELIHIVHRDNL